MAFLSNEVSLDFPYSVDDCYAAAKNAAINLPKFNLKSENKTAHILHFNVKPGMTSFSWGDIVTINISVNENNTSHVTISSTAKAPTALASVQQNKNVNLVIDALTEELKSYTAAAPSTQETKPESTAKDRLSKLNELRESNLISEEEYEQKRAEVLASI